MKIGPLELDNITVSAPLAGVSNLPFRLLAKDAGCALVCSEMVSSHGLVYGSDRTFEYLKSNPLEKPLSVQIFGSDPSIMSRAAQIVEASGADIVDINLGCSVKKVLKTGSGAALMKEPKKIESIIKAIRETIRIPLTVKMRSGWDYSGDQALKIAKIARDCGVDAITLHPRTATQGFGGKANWPLIKRVKQSLSIPVIGNGDIFCAEDALNMKQLTGCDAVMIGRTAIGNPWIFSQVISRFKGERITTPDLSERFDCIYKYLEDSIDTFGEIRACRMMRSRLGWFVKGLTYSSRFRESIKKISSKDEALKLINEYKDCLSARPCNPTSLPLNQDNNEK